MCLKKIVCFLIGILFVLTNIVNAAASETINASYSIQRIDHSTSRTYNGIEGKVILFYDKVTVLTGNSEISNRINNVIQHDVDNLFSHESGFLGYLSDENLVNQSKHRGNSMTFEYHVENKSVFMNESIISINSVSFWFIGGAIDTQYHNFTFDLKTGEQIPLPSFLGINQEKTKALAISTVQEKTQLLPDLYNPYFQNVNPDEYKYYVGENGEIHLLFDKYAIGPGAAGSPDLVLDYVPLPQIKMQPQGYAGECGDTAIFSIHCYGINLVYSWQSSNDGGKTWNSLETSSPELRVKISPQSDGNLYRCIIENTEGGKVLSLSATLWVIGEDHSNPFVDISPDMYYFGPVLWAVNHTPQITNGTSANTFSPEATCTRDQIVTFLWRAMGCPEPTSTVNPFVDVQPSDYFYKPVLWAVEKGITNGMDATHFGPTVPCSRAHVVTFLWRAHEKSAAVTNNPFVDVPTGQYYTDAVLWAVSKGITNGMDKTHFGPDAPCQRGQIVTFLYRDLK